MKYFVKWYDTVQVQSKTQVYSSFVSIHINPAMNSFLIYMLAGIVWGSESGFAQVAWLLINIARVGVKVMVG